MNNERKQTVPETIKTPASTSFDTLSDTPGLFRIVFENAATGICLMGLDGRFLKVNHAFCQMLGYSEAELLVLDFQSVSFPEDIKKIETRLADMVANRDEDGFQLEKRCICKDGDVMWTFVSVALVKNEQDEPQYFVVVAQDITRRKQAEEKLRFQAQLLDSVRESVVATDLEGHIIYWSKGAEELYGYAAEEVMGQPITFIVASEDRAEEEARMRQVMENGYWEGTYRQQRRDGASFWADTRIMLMRDEGGQPVGLIGIDRDVTDRVASEAMLRKSEEHFRRLMQASPIAIQVFAPDGTMVDANWRWEQMWGVSVERMVGRFNPLRVDVLREWGIMSFVERAFAGEEVDFPDFEYDPQLLGLQGDRLWVRMRTYPIYDDQNQLVNVVALSEDITEQKETAVALRQTSERLSVLREIDQAILAAQTPQEIALAALSRMRQLISCQRISLILFDFEADEAQVLITNTEGDYAIDLGSRLPLALFDSLDRLAEGKIVQEPDLSSVDTVDGVRKMLAAVGISSIVSIPLLASGQLIGALYLGKVETGLFAPAYIDIGREVATQLAIAIQQSHLLAAERERRQEAETLRTVTGAIASTLDLEQVLQLILEQLRRVVDYDSATIFLWQKGSFRGVAAVGLPDIDQVVGMTYPDTDPLSHKMRVEQEPILLQDAQMDPRFQKWGETSYVRGWMGIPLVARGEFIGHLTVDSRRRGAYGSAQVKQIRPFANQAAQAIENARLYDEVQHHAHELEMTIAKLKETQHQLVLQERLAAVGQLAAGIAHDFNNILAVIVLYTQLLQRTATLSEVNKQRVETVVEQSKRATSLIQQILDFSRQSMIEKRPLSLATYLKELGKLLQRTLPETIQIQLEHAEEVPYTVNVDATSLQQLVMNLAVNARDAMPDGGALTIKLEELHNDTPIETNAMVDLPTGHWVVMHVTDTGVGIEPDVQKRVFEPFFTTKPTGRGTGLGLAQAYGIVKQHDGYIFCHSVPGQGATFSVYLPAIADDVIAASGSGVAISQGMGETVLLVEDNDLTRSALLDILESLNYEVIAVANGLEATAVLEARDDIDLVLSDVVMPQMGGLALYEWMKENRPHVKLLLMTGYAMDEHNKLVSEHIQWIKKPFIVDELAGVLEEMFNR